MQNPAIKQKMMDTKIQNGSFTKSNSSREATKFIQAYIKGKGYNITQCAYADAENELHEWGIYHQGRWRLYDLVVFEKGKRGDKNHIIEVLEYNGPFHYTKQDVKLRGTEKAYPWKSNNTTIAESYRTDKIKKQLAKTLTKHYTIINADDI